MANTLVSFPKELALVATEALIAKAKAAKRKTVKVEDLTKIFQDIQIVPSNIPNLSPTAQIDEKKKKKRSKKDPNAPKRKMNTYNRFQQAYSLAHKDEFEKSKEVFKAAAAKWSSTKDDVDARNALLKEYDVEIHDSHSSNSSDSDNLKSPPSPAENSSKSDDDDQDDHDDLDDDN